MKLKSSFQELMELVADQVESKEPAELAALYKRLKDLRAVFHQDRDLLEAVIRRVERALRSRS